MLPRLHFAHLPTPIEALPRLSAALGGPKLLVKRDDQTGLAFGGNKTRKLEFLLAEAKESGAQTLITAGAVQSNHCRQTAAVRNGRSAIARAQDITAGEDAGTSGILAIVVVAAGPNDHVVVAVSVQVPRTADRGAEVVIR